jgi:hypothetical protein
MATISAQISEELMDEAGKRSEQLYSRQNRSAYIVDLIKKDLAGTNANVTRADEDCFMRLADEFIDAEWGDIARKSLKAHNVKQSHFLGHIIREASQALSQLVDEQDWHDIKFTLPAVETIAPPPKEHQQELDQIRADMVRNKALNKKTG